MESISDPIDIIDLTVDSPVNKTSKICNRNPNRTSRNSATAVTTKAITKRKRSDIGKWQLSDSIIEIPSEHSCKNIELTEIIDLDKSNLFKNTENDNAHSCEKKTTPFACPICFSELSSERKPMSTRCGHIFCRSCLELATEKKKICPICKTKVTLRTCISVYLDPIRQ